MMNERIELEEVYTEVGFKAIANTTEDTVPYTADADAEWLKVLEG
jgi:hypothetical protein